MIELDDVPLVLEVLPEVWMGKLGLEDIGPPEAKESHSEARDLHCHTEHVQHPHADHTSVTQLNVIGEWTSNLGHSSQDPN